MTAASAAADPVEAASLTAPLVEVNTEVVAMVAALPVRVAERGPGVGRRLWNLCPLWQGGLGPAEVSCNSGVLGRMTSCPNTQYSVRITRIPGLPAGFAEF